MEEEDSFLGGQPPVSINASRCGSITINIRLEIHAADPELRDLCERILGMEQGKLGEGTE